MKAQGRNSFLSILIGGSIILTLALGIRHSFGIYFLPISQSHEWERGVFALAIALQNLLWGIAQPFVGAWADRYGSKVVVMSGVGFYILGLILMALSSTVTLFTLGTGVLVGLALSATSFTIILGAVAKVAPESKRTWAMGVVSAAGSFGQFLMLPTSLIFIKGLGWSNALLLMASFIALALPIAYYLLQGIPKKITTTVTNSVSKNIIIGNALKNKDFIFLSLSFFVCGFQVVFIGIHLPAYLTGLGFSASVGTNFLALVGLFNIFGTYIAGVLGDKFSKSKLLAGIYFLRAIAIISFLTLPVTQLSVYSFGILMGLLWLSTVPLTNSLVASIFGTKNFAMLGGVVFLFHQIGAFLGGWLSGYLYDTTHSYNISWVMAIVLSFIAIGLDLLIKGDQDEHNELSYSR